MYVESDMNMMKGQMRIIKKIVKNNKLLSDISIKIQCSLTFCFIDCHWKYFWTKLFTGTVPANKNYVTGTVNKD